MGLRGRQKLIRSALEPPFNQSFLHTGITFVGVLTLTQALMSG